MPQAVQSPGEATAPGALQSTALSATAACTFGRAAPLFHKDNPTSDATSAPPATTLCAVAVARPEPFARNALAARHFRLISLYGRRPRRVLSLDIDKPAV